MYIALQLLTMEDQLAHIYPKICKIACAVSGWKKEEISNVCFDDAGNIFVQFSKYSRGDSDDHTEYVTWSDLEKPIEEIIEYHNKKRADEEFQREANRLKAKRELEELRLYWKNQFQDLRR